MALGNVDGPVQWRTAFVDNRTTYIKRGTNLGIHEIDKRGSQNCDGDRCGMSLGPHGDHRTFHDRHRTGEANCTRSGAIRKRKVYEWLGGRPGMALFRRRRTPPGELVNPFRL